MALCFPQKVLQQHLIVLGKTGAGKSSTLRHIVEDLLERSKRVCILDIKGDWWGLKSSADGKSAGYPVIAFGSFREPKATDVPINRHSGAEVAELIVSGNRPCVIGFRGWMPADITEFWIGSEPRWSGFASTLFNKNEGELYVVISECHNFAPKGKILDPKAGRVLHWTNRLLSEGRGLGMTFLLDSQRPQKVHNDTLTSCETLVAMRVTYPADRDAVKDWIKGCGDEKVGAQVLNSLAQLSRGEAWMWSPEIGFGPQRLQFPMFKTFDSFAPAQLQKKVSQSGWSSVDLEAVKQKLATVIQEAEDNDPTKLKQRIGELQQHLRTAEAAAERAQVTLDPTKTREIVDSAIAARDAEWNRAIAEYETKDRAQVASVVTDTLDSLIAYTTAAKKHINEHERHKVIPPPAPNRTATVTVQNIRTVKPTTTTEAVARALAVRIDRQIITGKPDDLLNAPERAVLTVLAQRPQGLPVDRLAMISGYTVNGHFNNTLGKLRSTGCITPPRETPIKITDVGLSTLGTYDPRPAPGRKLQEYWLQKLSTPEQAVLRVLLEHYPRAIALEDLATAAGYTVNGHFNNVMGSLRGKGLISPPRQPIVASSDFFSD